jgi:mRNA-degrading endonuclease RelE of RelBE toxin-antitoxin system
MDWPIYDNAQSMAHVLDHVFGLGSTLLQGSMYDGNLLFQLHWSPSVLEIIQVGVLLPKRKQKLASQWLMEVLSICHFHRIRVIARNVQSTGVEKKLQSSGFVPLGNNDFAFPC